MPNQKRNGLDDLDILDLDELLRENDTENVNETETQAPQQPSAVPEQNSKKTTLKKRECTPEEPSAKEDDLPDGIHFVDVVPTENSQKKAPGSQDSEQPSPRRLVPEKASRSKSEGDVRLRRAPAAGRPPLHLILPIVIAAVLIIAIARFMMWSKGKDLHIDSSDNADRFNIEVNDNMVYLPDSKLEGHEDDGVTTILCLGNEPFSEDTSENGLAGQIASLGNCNVINAAFPDSQVTCENATYSTDSLDSMDDIFNLFYVSYAISVGDFSSLKTVASVHTEDPTYEQSVEALENTDFSKVDMIAIMYDGIDYINGMAMQNPDVPDELTTYVGSLMNSFQLIQEKYPYIRIVFLSPYYAEYDGASSRTTDLGNGTIVNYFQWAYDTCGDCSVSFLDNYYGSINETNYKDYLSDGIHLNAAGRTKVADHFVYKVLQDNYAEYNAQTLSVAKQ